MLVKDVLVCRGKVTIRHLFGISCVGILLSSVIIFFLYDPFHWNDYTNGIFYNMRACNLKRQQSSNQSFVRSGALPTCLMSWAKSDRESVLNLLQKRGFSIASSQNRSKYCNPHMTVAVYANQELQRFMHHLPHFCEVYFNFYSLLMWQDLLLSHSCVSSLVISDKVNSFWLKSSKDSDSHWMRDLVSLVEAQRNIRKSIFSDKCYATVRHESLLRYLPPQIQHIFSEVSRNEFNGTLEPGSLKGWFLHPISAITLTATILNVNPCSQTIIQRPDFQSGNLALKVTILGRNNDRKLLNINEVELYLQSRPYTKSINVVYFHGGLDSLRKQALVAYNTDVLIAAHGAGNTNIAFMKPCSILLEIFPTLFYIPQYFEDLARSAGVLYASIQVNANSSHYKDLAFQSCKHVFSTYMYTGNKFTSGNEASLNEKCFNDPSCRSCARGVDSITVDVQQLNAVLDKALDSRAICIRDSLYYKAISQESVSTPN